MGTVSVTVLRSLDRRYTEVINRTVPVLNDLRALTAETFATFRALGTNALFNAPLAPNRPMRSPKPATLSKRRKVSWVASSPTNHLPKGPCSCPS
jgi:hypothetical protein